MDVQSIGTLLVCSECGTGHFRPYYGVSKCDACHKVLSPVDVLTDDGERVVWVGGRLAVVTV